MLALSIYFGAMGFWVGSHVVLDELRTRKILYASHVKAAQHVLQIVFVTVAVFFDLWIRPYIAAECDELDRASAPWALIYGLPQGTFVFTATVCAGIDGVRMHAGESATNWKVGDSWSFLVGLVFFIIVPPTAALALASVDSLVGP